MALAPIGISTYSRLDHLKQNIKALQRNTLAKQSELYIFSDAPKLGDEDKVQAVRDYLKTIGGFKCIHVVERVKNNRVANNRGGMRMLLDKYDRMIFLEEDIVTAPGFLRFMNEGLEFYKDDDRIISITGFTPPIKVPKNYMNDFIVLQRFNAWGFAVWKDQFDKIQLKLDKDEYLKNISNKKFYRELASNGADIPSMLEQEIDGNIDALDVKIMYQQIKNGWYTISPKKSLVQNTGIDGSGEHSGSSDRFNHDILWDKSDGFVFDKKIQVDKRIKKENYKLWSNGLRARFGNFAKQVGIYPVLKTLKEIMVSNASK